MKKYFFIAFLLFSKFIFGQVQNVETQFFGQLYENYLQNPIFFYDLPMNNFTQSSLFFHQEEGNFKLGQEKVLKRILVFVLKDFIITKI